MNLTQEHINFENSLQQLLGLTLLKVEYLEVNYEPENPKPFYKTRFEEIDTIDFAIIFQTDKAKVEFYWDGQFFQFGIGVRFNQTSETATGQKWDVSKNDMWQNLLGQQITNVKLTWEEVTSYEEKTGKSNKYIYPQDLRIDFSCHKSIFISAAEFLNANDSEVKGLSDNLTVTDNESLARQVKMIN